MIDGVHINVDKEERWRSVGFDSFGIDGVHVYLASEMVKRRWMQVATHNPSIVGKKNATHDPRFCL